MLDRILFVGAGGSGGKTLRVIRHELRRRLREAGYPGDIPAAWQFLYLDVRFEQERDDEDTRLPAALPEECYVRLTERGLRYEDIDMMLSHRSEALREHLAGWRPQDPNGVGVPLIEGAGQYRAVGRMVAASSMPDIVKALQSASNRVTQVGTGEELAEVSRYLGEDRGQPHPNPLVVVIGSLAGGSGAGMLIDLCDALRAMGTEWGESIAVLYTPDVFGFKEIPETRRAGVSPNTLAIISELLASYWGGKPTDDSLAVLNSATATLHVDRRGPRYPFLVGSGEQVRFSHHLDVFLAVGRTMASWVTSKKVLQELRSIVIGNWHNTAVAETVSDQTKLAPGAERPFSSFGHASVSLGRRERFAAYAADRLAGDAVRVVLNGHRPSAQRAARRWRADRAGACRHPAAGTVPGPMWPRAPGGRASAGGRAARRTSQPGAERPFPGIRTEDRR